MNRIEIEILEPITDAILGLLDLGRGGDLSLKLTKETSTITNIVTRRGTYSLDFDLPDTPNNRQLLFGVGFVPSSGNSLSILRKKNARIKVNNTEIERGFIRFSEGKWEGNYRATFYGGNNEWADQLNNLYLYELEYRNLGEISPGVELFDASRIATVNNGDSTNYDISYPFVERNTGSAGDQLRPVIYVKKLIQRMFEAIGFTVESDFLNSTFVAGDGAENKGIVFDPAVTFEVDPDRIELLRAEITTDRFTPLQDPNTWNTDYFIGNLGDNVTKNIRSEWGFANFWNVETKDPGDFDPVTGVYTAPFTGSYDFIVSLPDFEYARNTAGPFNTTVPVAWTYADVRNYNLLVQGAPPKVQIKLVKNNVGSSTINGTVVYEGSAGNPLVDELSQAKIALVAGDTLQVFFTMDYQATLTISQSSPNRDFWRFHPGSKAVFKAQPSNSIKLGDAYIIKDYIPTELKCLEVLQDFKIMFNLYFEADVYRKKVIIEPRDTYFLPLDQAKDITNIIDLDRIKIDRKLPYKQFLSWRYAEDSKDGYLSRWNTLNNRTYAEYTHELTDRFEAGEIVYSTKIIAPTIQKIAQPSNIVSSNIQQYWDVNENQGKGITQGYKPRVYQVVRAQQFDANGNPYRTSSPFVVSAALMESFGNVPTIDDKKLTFNGANGLVDLFYAKTISNIEAAAIVELKVAMSLWQFKNWNMRQLVYIDRPEQIKGYYIVEAIKNYNINGEDLVELRLLTYKDFIGATIPSGGTNISSQVTTTQTTGNNYFPILVTVNGVTVNCLDNNGNPMYKI